MRLDFAVPRFRQFDNSRSVIEIVAGERTRIEFQAFERSSAAGLGP